MLIGELFGISGTFSSNSNIIQMIINKNLKTYLQNAEESTSLQYRISTLSDLFE